MTGNHLEEKELREIGFASIGRDPLISRRASFHGASRIRVGSNVRIDDFCVLSAGEGGIDIGNHVHVAVFASLIGKGHIQVGDYANISSRVSIYSSSDDYSGAWMTNPTIPEQFTNVTHGDVFIGRHVIIGSGSVVLPGISLDEGVAIGALSLVRESCGAFGIYAGAPARHIGIRSRSLLEVERTFIAGRGA